ncbi:13111_t:CDS:2, partial [Dentiscutata erythropus]
DDQQSEQNTDLDLEDISICSENEFNINVDCSSDNKSESISTNIDNLPKIFDGTKFRNYECLFEPFNNFTNLAMFIWATKYMTLQILRYPKFDINHLPTNLQSLKKQCKQLPLMKIHSYMVPINIKSTPSTIKDSTRVYYFSLIEHLQQILKNSSLSSQLYFGPGIFSKSCEELWEGDLWAESPLFGQPNLSTAQDIYIFYLYLRQTLQYLSSKRHVLHLPQELYLVEKSNSFLIEPSSLICHLSIWLKDQPTLSIIDFFVNQILYNYNGR